MYDYLDRTGVYLPKKSSQCLTDKFLEGIQCKTFFSL